VSHGRGCSPNSCSGATASVSGIGASTPIIAFCKDWDDDPTSNHHVLGELSKATTVVWLNSLGMRRPSLVSGSDRLRLLRKLRELVRRPRNVSDRLWVVTPIVLPFPHSKLAQRLNVRLLGLELWRLRRRLALEDFQLWTFLPNVADYVGRFGESLSVYYCVDEFSLFSELDTERTIEAERELLAKVDCVFAVNDALRKAKREHNPETHLSPHGVDRDLFATALDSATTVPADLARLSPPVLGFYGSIADWVDLELVAGVARRRPDWNVALIGLVTRDTGAIDPLPNVHLLGRRPHTMLPAYCKGFGVGLIPYLIDERSPYVNPVKLREYLSSGLPVVSTPVDEVLSQGTLCAVAVDADGFVGAIEEAFAADSAMARGLRSAAMVAGTWQARVQAVAKTVEEVEARKLASGSGMPAPIISFSKDWDDDLTSNHHILRQLAKSRRVLWLNSVATRAPSLGSGRDMRRVGRKLREFLRGPVNVENDLWVFTPLVLPLPESRLVRRLNSAILALTVRRLRRRLRMDQFQLWTFLPNVGDYIGRLGESLSVYYCVDEWSLFSQLDEERTRDAERVLLARVDCVFAVNDALADAKRPFNPETHVAPHGVDREHFKRALSAETTVPADLASLPGPVLGFYGTIADWVDVGLLAQVAKLRPDWTLALIGTALISTAALEKLPNVHLLGRRSYDALPAYCKGFDVALIPYLESDQLPYRNPIKLREYLAAGLPVVSTPVPEVERYADSSACVESAGAMVEAVEAALATDSPERRAERSLSVADETWEARASDVAATVDALASSRQRVLA
jgi:glycosyltransferase involved in cell wall biosynthesis